MSEEEVEKGFLSGSEAYSLLEQVAKAEPRRQIKTKGIPAGLNSCGWHRSLRHYCHHLKSALRRLDSLFNTGWQVD